MDAPIIRSFQKELFSLFLPASYAGHVGLAAAKWKYGSTVEFISFRFQDVLFAYYCKVVQFDKL